ncbi:hypothetical protein D3C71_1574650 [compost metagenome]
MAFGNAHAVERFQRQRALLRLEHAQPAAPPGRAVQQAHQHVHQHGQAVHQVELLEHKTHLRTHLADVAVDAPALLHAAAIDFDQ